LGLDLRVRGENHRETLYDRDVLGRVCLLEGKWFEAERLYAENLTVSQRVNSLNHFDTFCFTRALAEAELALGRFTDAEKRFRMCREGYTQKLGREHNLTRFATVDHARALFRCGRLEEAVVLAHEYVTALRPIDKPENLEIARGLFVLSCVQRLCGQWDAAEASSREATEKCRRLHGEKHFRTLRHANEQATVLLGLGRYADAETQFQQVLDARRQTFPEDHPELADSLNGYGELLLELGRVQASLPVLEEALRIQRQSLPSQHPATGQTLAALGWAYTCGGDAVKGEPLLQDGSALVRKTLPENHWFPADAESRLGGCLASIKRFDQAEPLLLDAYKELQDASGTPPARRTQALARLVHFYEARNLKDKAKEWRLKFDAEKKIEKKPGS
jgi:tetratricopeptide (TPR) repeat protein